MSTYPSGATIHWSRLWFFATAFTTGAVVMALEILGSRLLAPVFGNSLFVWGALIGVVLAAMSSGYATGGWLADRRPVRQGHGPSDRPTLGSPSLERNSRSLLK